ncbi:hypothetical protein [Sphingomonas trueperi]|uniref:Uncharacterized protein n=2 Tax=Sphingomonas TaxID=13687 RepID=A0A7X5Y0H7_9SPHN|nr:hypothetical protein [Sphingomonas trueperi]NJB97505.1 hypothetical protein [Sphingomonas trueperi]
MDLAYLLSRHQNALTRAGTAACISSRAAHRAFAAGYAERIAAYRQAHAMTVAA